ncbi:MAG: hypothetical protein FWE21_04190 [Defluviitaleaceae bacterium]|nr:hypothetical protein [Defluviitaleaceae bacterium]
MKRLCVGVLLMIGLFLAACGNNSQQTTPVTVDARPAENFVDFVVDYAFIAGLIPMAACEDYLWAAEFRTGNLINSNNHGEDWQSVYAFAMPIQAVHVDDARNIFVSVAEDRWAEIGTNQLFRSEDGGESWEKVLNVQSGAVIWWNIASQNGTMFVSEYGYKGYGDNARRIYHSTDFGKNWEVVFDPGRQIDHHNHKLIIAPDGVVYQAIGDGQNARIIRSQDLGDSWKTVIYGFLPTSAIAFESHILWGLDGGPWMGIAHHNRQTGEFNVSLNIEPKFYGPAYDMIYAHGVVYAIFLSYQGYYRPASIFYSTNQGDSWQLLGYIDKLPQYGVGMYQIIHDGRYAYIDFGAPLYRNGYGELFRGTLRFELLIP